jgi:hypothetical protein
VFDAFIRSQAAADWKRKAGCWNKLKGRTGNRQTIALN